MEEKLRSREELQEFVKSQAAKEVEAALEQKRQAKEKASKHLRNYLRTKTVWCLESLYLEDTRHIELLKANSVTLDGNKIGIYRLSALQDMWRDVLPETISSSSSQLCAALQEQVHAVLGPFSKEGVGFSYTLFPDPVLGFQLMVCVSYDPFNPEDVTAWIQEQQKIPETKWETFWTKTIYPVIYEFWLAIGIAKK